MVSCYYDKQCPSPKPQGRADACQSQKVSYIFSQHALHSPHTYEGEEGYDMWQAASMLMPRRNPALVPNIFSLVVV